MTRPVKARLATLDQLDGRTIAAKQAREVISSIEEDLGGRESISTARRALIENAAVVCTENLIHVDEMRESPKLTRWLRFYALWLRSWPRR
jgi:hypothetical protein